MYKIYENVQNIHCETNCADAQNIVNLHICTTKYYVSPHFKIVKIHKILCIAQITLYCTQKYCEPLQLRKLYCIVHKL